MVSSPGSMRFCLYIMNKESMLDSVSLATHRVYHVGKERVNYYLLFLLKGVRRTNYLMRFLAESKWRS
jgi:hypothetical protein